MLDSSLEINKSPTYTRPKLEAIKVRFNLSLMSKAET